MVFAGADKEEDGHQYRREYHVADVLGYRFTYPLSSRNDGGKGGEKAVDNGEESRRRSGGLTRSPRRATLWKKETGAVRTLLEVVMKLWTGSV